MTLAEQLDNFHQWRQRVQENTDSYATDEWRARATAKAEHKIAYVEAAIEEHGADFELPTIGEALTSPLFDEPQRAVIRWQYRKYLALGDFWTALFQAIEHADQTHQARLALAYPALIEGIQRYRAEDGYSDFMELIEKR